MQTDIENNAANVLRVREYRDNPKQIKLYMSKRVKIGKKIHANTHLYLGK